MIGISPGGPTPTTPDALAGVRAYVGAASEGRVLYGPGPFVLGSGYRQLFAAMRDGSLVGGVGVSITPWSIDGFTAEQRAAAGKVLALIPKLFALDRYTVEAQAHFGIAHMRIGGDPRWLAPPPRCSEGQTWIADHVGAAISYALSRVPFVVRIPLPTADLSHTLAAKTSVLERWAQEVCPHLVVMGDQAPKPDVLSVSIVDEQQRRARETLDELFGTGAHSNTGANTSMDPLEVFSREPQQKGAQMRMLELGSKFDPATHYTEDYYGGGAGIRYVRPDGSIDVYHGTAREWEGNKIVAEIVKATWTRNTAQGRAPVGGSLAKVLDIGCAAGDLVRGLDGAGYEAWGTDIADTKPVEGVDPTRIRIGDAATGLPFDAQEFDITTAFDVWEHIWEKDVDALMADVRRVTKRRGLHFACICTSSRVEAPQSFLPGVEVTKDNSWLLVSGHVTIQRWGWWVRAFQRAGLYLRYDLTTHFNVMIAEDPGLSLCASWGPRNVMVLEAK